MRRAIVSGLIVIMIMSFCSFAHGDAARDNKIDRGLKNVALGWTEIPKSVVETSKEQNVIVGVTGGLIKGVLNAAARTISGAADVGTAPIGDPSKPAIKPEIIE